MAETINNNDLQSTTPTGNPKSRVGTGFTNLQKYMKANTGAGEGLGQAITSGVQNVAGGLGQKLGQKETQFQQKSTDAYTPFQGGSEFAQQTIRDPLAGGYTPQAGVTMALDQTGTNVETPTLLQPEMNENTLQRFKTISGGQYTGPTSLTGTESIQSGVRNIGDMARLGTTTGGREALLGTFLNQPNYTTGERRLDTLLMSQGGDLTGLGQTANQAQRNYSNVLGHAGALAQTYKQQAQQLGQEAQSELGEEQFNREKELSQLLALKQKQEAELAPWLLKTKEQIGEGSINTADAAKMGMTPEQLQQISGLHIFNLNPADYSTTFNAPLPTNVAQTASKEQAVRMNALAQLGQQNARFGDLNKVSTYKPSNITFDTDKFVKAAAGAKQGYQDLYEREVLNKSLARLLLDPTRAMGGTVDMPGTSWMNTGTLVGNVLGGGPLSLAGIPSGLMGTVAQQQLAPGGGTLNLPYGDIGQSQYQYMINKYGNLDNAKNVLLTPEARQPGGYDLLSGYIDRGLKSLAALTPNRTFNVSQSPEETPTT